jgi:hypothetical protein
MYTFIPGENGESKNMSNAMKKNVNCDTLFTFPLKKLKEGNKNCIREWFLLFTYARIFAFLIFPLHFRKQKAFVQFKFLFNTV